MNSIFKCESPQLVFTFGRGYLAKAHVGNPDNLTPIRCLLIRNSDSWNYWIEFFIANTNNHKKGYWYLVWRGKANSWSGDRDISSSKRYWLFKTMELCEEKLTLLLPELMILSAAQNESIRTCVPSPLWKEAAEIYLINIRACSPMAEAQVLKT